MKRNIVLNGGIEEMELSKALSMAIVYDERIRKGYAINPCVENGLVMSYGDKNIYVRKVEVQDVLF